ncbi:MAG: hypothetical protein ACTSYD_01345 [Candidatus Heimdallarchaeaceae archaeon]
MFKQDYDMALSDEDLVMFVLGVIVFILTFADIRSNDTIASFSFPSILFFIIGWGIVRFRRRPLPKQVHHTRAVYLAHLKIIRNYQLFSLILLNILFLARYIEPGSAIRIGMIFQYASIFFLSLMEFFGHIVASDALLIIPELETDDPNILAKQRRNLLFGSKYWIWTLITLVLTIGLLYPSIDSIVAADDLVIYMIELLAFVAGFILYYLLYKRTMKFNRIMNAEMVDKAIDYYNLVGLREKSYDIINEYLKYDEKNSAILSKYAFMLTEDQRYTEVPAITTKILEETEQKGIRVPHLIAKAHLLCAISLAKMEKYQEAYQEVTASLKYIPENNVARKLRRELRKRLKTDTNLK